MQCASGLRMSVAAPPTPHPTTYPPTPSPRLRAVTMYVSDADGDEFAEVCLPVNLEDDGYNMIHTHDQSAAFILAGEGE